ncbi:MAG: hypothetical protein ACKO96_40550, partial [Flammeovirgaceae bacterium]
AQTMQNSTPIEVVNAEIVDNILPANVKAGEFTTQNFEQAMQNKGVGRTPIIEEQQVIDTMTINPQTLYQTAAQYETAAEKLANVRDGFARQAQQTKQEIIDLIGLYNQSPQPLDTVETTAATLAGAVLLPKALGSISKNVYNPETIAKQGLEKATSAMGKNPNWNPLNWIGNWVNGSYNVENMQHHVEEAVQNISGKNLAN